MTSCHHVPITSVRAAAVQYGKTSHYHNQRQSPATRLTCTPKSFLRYSSNDRIPKLENGLRGLPCAWENSVKFGLYKEDSSSCIIAHHASSGRASENFLAVKSFQYMPSHTSNLYSRAPVFVPTASQRSRTFQCQKDLKIAPILFRNSSVGLHTLSSSIDGKEKVNYGARKGGESAWRTALYRANNKSPVSASRTDVHGEQYPEFCRKDYNHNNKKDFPLISHDLWWTLVSNRSRNSRSRRAMSMSLLLDPIIGSPPSSLTSPCVEARDDISALSEGFTRKGRLLRRRLSTSFDEPQSRGENNRSTTVSSGASGASAAVVHVGPFGFRKGSDIVQAQSSSSDDEDARDKRIKINAWLAQLHAETLAKGRDGSPGSPGGKGNGNRSDSSHDNDGSGSGSSSPGPTSRIHEDLFELLEKVIGFKGRSISHITVEQSVKDLCTVYVDANDDDKLQFFTLLAEKHGVDHEYVASTATNLASCKDSDARLTLEEKLRAALVPKSQWLFTQIGRLENGVKFLVDMRTDLLDATEKSQGKSSLKALNNGLRDLIGMWFNVGFLNLERVTWQSSCDMLQKVSEYEAVHPMRNWTDLKKRVGPNRRCFVFTHNSMPSEPVVVLHTFLTDHIPSSIQKIVSSHKMRMMSLDSDLPLTSTKEDPDFINTAAFYSITSTQRGLTGIELGNYLIKRVVRELQSEFPKMTQYSSLSPIPGFSKWLVGSIKNEMKNSSGTQSKLLNEQEIQALKPIFENYSRDKDFYQVLLDLLKLNSWFSDERLVKELENPLMRLCAQYLYVIKRRGYALDPVAHFHLRNGAVLWRLNWRGDESPRGLGQSCGIMVNYRYFLEACEGNSQNYMENQVIQISDQVNHLVKLTDS